MYFCCNGATLFQYLRQGLIYAKAGVVVGGGKVKEGEEGVGVGDGDKR